MEFKNPRVKFTGDFQFYTFIESIVLFFTKIINEILFAITIQIIVR